MTKIIFACDRLVRSDRELLLMRKLLALSVILASPALAQTPAGVINAPIYATGYISQVGGANVTTNIPPQPNHPTNLNIYTTGVISGAWTIKLPNPAFEGQMLSFNCGAAANVISVTSSDGSTIDSTLPTACSINSGFTIQFDQRSNIWRNIGSNNTSTFKPFTGVASQWPWQLNADGTWTLKRPTFADLAAGQVSVETAFSGQNFFAPVGQTAASNWLKTYAYGDNNTSVVGLNRANGGVAIVGASRASDSTGGDVAPIGIVGWGFADGTGAKSSYPAWASYFECRAGKNSTGYCAADETDITSFRASAVVLTPYTPFAPGSTYAKHIAIGGGCNSVTPCYDPTTGATDGVAGPVSAGLLITENDSTHVANALSGILFSQYSINGADGTDTGSVGEAVGMARGHALDWRVSGGGLSFQVASLATSVGPSGKLYWANNGLILQNGSGTTLFQQYPSTGHANGIAQISAATGSNPSITCYSDTNADCGVTLQGKGTGLPNLVSPTFGGATGYLYANGSGAATYSTTIPASSLSGSTLPAGITASSLTSVGTLTSLTVAGTVTVNAATFNMTSSAAFQPQMTFFNQNNDSSGGYYIVQKGRGAVGSGASAVQVGDTLGTFLFRGLDSNGTATNSSSFISAIVDSVAAGSVTSHLALSGNVTFDTGGIAVGSPTGGYKGAGTINAAAAYYANGTAGVTCNAGLGGTSRTINGIVTTC